MMKKNETIISLLKKQHVKGIFIGYVIRLFILLIFYISILLSFNSFTELIIESPALLAAIIFSAYAVFKIKKTGSAFFFGKAGMIIDILLMFFAAFSWYYTLSSPAPERAYITKNLITFICMFLILINGLSLNKKYPIVAGAASVLLHISILTFAAMDSTTKFSNSLLDIIKPDTVILMMFMYRTIGIIAFTFLVAYMTDIYVKTVYLGAELENKNTQIGKYFPPAISHKLTKKSDSFFQPGGQSKEATILFADIRDLSAMNETYKSEDLFYIHTQYHNIFIETIFKNNGSIIKFTGDGIMAAFGIPDSSENDIFNAVQCGWEALIRIDDLNESLYHKKLIPIKVGIGIHFGPVTAGNIGTAERLEYAVIGDTVNITNRIESAAKLTGKNFLVSRIIYNSVQNSFNCEHAGKIAVKGQKEPIDLYNIIGEKK